MLNPDRNFHQSKSPVKAGGFGIRQICFGVDKSHVKTPRSKQVPWHRPAWA